MNENILTPVDKNQLDNWYRLYGDELYRTLCKSVRNTELAKEISQDAFCKVAVRLSRTDINDVIENPRAFLYKVAFNEIYTKHKKQKLENHLSELFGDEIFAYKDEITPEKIVMDREELKTVENLIKNLPVKQRKTFLMSRMDHMTHSEIANDLNIDQGTVKQRIVRILAALKLASKGERQKND